MDHIKHAPLDSKFDQLIMLVIGAVVAGLVGFAAGQANPPAAQPKQVEIPAYEDWHGNVRRSYDGR